VEYILFFQQPAFTEPPRCVRASIHTHGAGEESLSKYPTDCEGIDAVEEPAMGAGYATTEHQHSSIGLSCLGGCGRSVASNAEYG
jgi:hypothetical protein